MRAMSNTILDDEYIPYGSAGKIPVKIGTRIRLIDPAGIAYAKSCGDYVDISLASGEVLHTKEQIARLEDRLPRLAFARVHRSYIVNLGSIREIRTRQNGYELVLSDGQLIKASSTYRRLIRSRMLSNTQQIPGAGAAEERLQLRACGPGDEHRLALIGQGTFMETFAEYHPVEDILAHCATWHSPDFYRAWLEDPKVRIWMLERGESGVPVGYVAVTPADPSVPECRADELVLQRIYLKESWYDRCRKSRLLANVIHHARKLGCQRLWAWDFVENKRVLEFYASVGFRPRTQYPYRVGGGEYQQVALSLDL